MILIDIDLAFCDFTNYSVSSIYPHNTWLYSKVLRYNIGCSTYCLTGQLPIYLIIMFWFGPQKHFKQKIFSKYALEIVAQKQSCEAPWSRFIVIGPNDVVIDVDMGG